MARPLRQGHAIAALGSLAPLYARLLGRAWGDLAEEVRRMHGGGETVHCAGTFRVRHGTGWLARFLIRFLRLPAAAEAVAVRLDVVPDGQQERWLRWFGEQFLASRQRGLRDGLLAEQVGPVELRFRLLAEGGALRYRLVRTCMRWLSVPLPSWLSPQVAAEEAADGTGRLRVEVTVTSRGGRALISYDGWLVVEEPRR